MIDTTAFATSANLTTVQTNSESSINAVSTRQRNHYYNQAQTDGFLNAKAGLAGPSFTGTMNAVNMIIIGTLVNGGTNVLPSLNNEGNISDSYNKTETGKFLGSKVGYIYESNLLLDSFIGDV